MLSLSRTLRVVRRWIAACAGVDYRCPVCGHCAVVSAAACLALQNCRHCGYPDFQRRGAYAGLPAKFKTTVSGDLAWTASGQPVTESEQYEIAAMVAERRGLTARQVADLLLRAAWACVDERDVEAERFFRRKAAGKFEAALRDFGAVTLLERPMVTYLVGEQWRRVGDRRLASAWFDRVPLEVVNTRSQRWIVDAARQQRDCPQEWAM